MIVERSLSGLKTGGEDSDVSFVLNMALQINSYNIVIGMDLFPQASYTYRW
jgi:hypothetical protein